MRLLALLRDVRGSWTTSRPSADHWQTSSGLTLDILLGTFIHVSGAILNRSTKSKLMGLEVGREERVAHCMGGICFLSKSLA